MTRHVSRVLPSDAGTARWKVEAIGGLSSSAARKSRGCVAGLQCPGGVFGELEYPTPPLRASTEAKRKALEAAYQDIVTSDLPEWNQDPGLLDWLASL